MLPTLCPLYTVSMAWAASVITSSRCFFAMDMIASISQGLPAKWTGIIALVRLVILFSIRLGSIFMVCLSISTNTGLAPMWVITLAVAAKVIGVVIISSSWPRPDTIMARWSPAVQEWSAIAYLVPMYFLNMPSNLATLGQIEIGRASC